LAALLAGPDPIGQAAGMWGYLLVQSLFGLVAGARPRRTPAEPGNAFERAARRLERLLEA
jgi:hypothetical protein